MLSRFRCDEEDRVGNSTLDADDNACGSIVPSLRKSRCRRRKSLSLSLGGEMSDCHFSEWRQPGRKPDVVSSVLT